MALAPLPQCCDPLDVVNAWECQDKTHYRAICMKFSDLWHQVDQTRQSDYVFCEPPKRDGLDPPMKQSWQGAPLLLDQRSHHQCFPDITESQPLFQLSLKVTNIIFSWTVRTRKKLGIFVLYSSAGIKEWRSGKAGNLCYLEFRHESAKVEYSTWQTALELEATCKSSDSLSSSYSGLCPNSAQPRRGYTHIFLLN